MRHRVFVAGGLVAGLALSVTLVFALAGCGGGSDEAVLVEAQDALREARTAVLAASEVLKGKEEALAAAQGEVEQARGELRKAQAELTTVEARVDLKATDGLLFRSIQRMLLDDERLRAAAIGVSVEKGVVTLAGEAPDGESQKIALKLAREVPGVASVVNKIVVSVAALPEAP